MHKSSILFKLFNGLLYVNRLPFGMLFKYQREELLIYYEKVSYSDIINRIKEKYKYQYYLKKNENYNVLNFMLYKEKIINVIIGQYKEIIRSFYLDIYNVLEIDISKYIVNNIRG